MESQNTFQNKLKKIKNLFSQLVDVSNDINVSTVHVHIYLNMKQVLPNFFFATTDLVRFEQFESDEKK